MKNVTVNTQLLNLLGLSVINIEFLERNCLLNLPAETFVKIDGTMLGGLIEVIQDSEFDEQGRIVAMDAGIGKVMMDYQEDCIVGTMEMFGSSYVNLHNLDGTLRQVSANGQVLQENTYTESGEIESIRITDPTGVRPEQVITYTRDESGKVVSDSVNEVVGTFEYDDRDNILVNRRGDVVQEFTHDSQDNMTSVTVNGELKLDLEISYKDGQLISIVDQDENIHIDAGLLFGLERIRPLELDVPVEGEDAAEGDTEAPVAE